MSGGFNFQAGGGGSQVYGVVFTSTLAQAQFTANAAGFVIAVSDPGTGVDSRLTITHNLNTYMAIYAAMFDPLGSRKLRIVNQFTQDVNAVLINISDDLGVPAALTSDYFVVTFTPVTGSP